MEHEDSAAHGWPPRRQLQAMRERATLLIDLAKTLRTERVQSEAEVVARLARALLPARRLRPTQNGPISDQYYMEPIDSK
jgi:hypothetical protein